MDTKIYDTNSEDCIFDGDFFRWPDGAKLYHEPNSIVIEPDSDARKAAQAIEFYWGFRLSRAVNEFDERKAGLRSWAAAAKQDGCTPPGESQLAELEELRQVVEYCKRKFAKAQEKVQATVPAHIQANRADRAKNQDAGQNFIQKLADMTV